MEITIDREQEYYRVLLRFSSSQNNYSCLIPKNWTVKILKNFLNYSFKNEIKSSFSIIYSGKILLKDDQLISSILKKEEKLNQLFITLKSDKIKESKLEKNLKDPKKFDVVHYRYFRITY
jgi:GTP-binding protein EngB required for normal cell division